MKVTIFVVALVSAGLSFAAGFCGGAVLNRPSRQNYDSKVAQVRKEAEQSEQEITEKLRQAQGVVQGLEKEVRYLNNELVNMTTALGEANRKVREKEAELLSTSELKNQEEDRASSKEDDLITQNTIARLKKTLAEQTEENKRLLALCKEAGIQTAKPEKTSLKSGEIIYRGKERDMRWFNAMHGKFYDKIACVDNTYFNISEALLKFNKIEPHHMVWPVGSPVRVPYNCSVLSVVRKGQVLISNRSSTVIAHIHGLERSFVDGQDFLPVQTLYIYTGSFNYTTAIGGKKTVPSLAIYKPLTKKQFADALNNGFVLSYPNERRGRVEMKTVP